MRPYWTSSVRQRVPPEDPVHRFRHAVPHPDPSGVHRPDRRPGQEDAEEGGGGGEEEHVILYYVIV